MDLALDFFRSGLYSCGTQRTSCKGFPDALKSVAVKKLKERGTSKTRQHGNQTVFVCQDNRPVLIATNSDSTTTSSVYCKSKDGTSKHFLAQIHLHLRWTHWVSDQLCGYYHARFKCKKHYVYIFFFLFDWSIANNFILCQTLQSLLSKWIPYISC